MTLTLRARCLVLVLGCFFVACDQPRRTGPDHVLPDGGSDGGVVEGCESTLDCDTGWVCLDGDCVFSETPACRSDVDCAGGPCNLLSEKCEMPDAMDGGFDAEHLTMGDLTTEDPTTVEASRSSAARPNTTVPKNRSVLSKNACPLAAAAPVLPNVLAVRFALSPANVSTAARTAAIAPPMNSATPTATFAKPAASAIPAPAVRSA